jgi:uncharacterized protein (DUF488 family)
MRSAQFLEAISSLLAELQTATTAVMCSESQWWRCHRRLIADFAKLARGIAMFHLNHDGRLTEHPVGAGARLLPKVCLSTTCPEAASQSGIDYRAP